MEPPSSERKEQVHVSGVSLTRMSVGAVREKLWGITARWATLHYGDQGAFGGRLKEVTGEIYDQGVVVSEFKADTAEADKASSTLTLAGNIVVRDRREGAELRCDAMVYRADLRRIEAVGPVILDAPGYRVGPFDKAFARADLSLLATPELFKD